MAVHDLVARRYAKALFNTARPRGLVEEIRGQLETAADALTGGAQQMEFWKNPLVPLSRKRGVLELGLEQLGGACGGECGQFLMVLLKNARLEFLPAIAAVYGEMADEAAGRAPVWVRTAMPISEDESARLADALGRVLGAEAVLKVAEDPSLLAGIVVTARDIRYDGSARGRLERFLAAFSQ